MHRMTILDHIHRRLYDKNIEAQEIWRITQPEVDRQSAEAWRIFRNTRVSDADIEGIEIWEKIYGIKPNLTRDTLEERRERILEMKRAQPPFSEPWLNFELARRAVLAGELPESIQALLNGLMLTLIYDSLPDAPRTHRDLMPWIRGIVPANVMVYSSVILPRVFVRPIKKRLVTAFTLNQPSMEGRYIPRKFMKRIQPVTIPVAVGAGISNSNAVINPRPLRPQ